MKWIRCKDCGMSIKVGKYDFVTTCPICGAKVYINTAEHVRSMEDYYNSSNFQSYEHDHVNDVLKNNNINKNSTPSNNQISSKNKQANVVGVIIGIIFFVFFILMASIASGV